jgi:hypothetical protein
MNSYDEFVDDELSIQGTASDALVSKSSARKLGYYHDPFLEIFCKRGGTAKDGKKPPIINRGYFARVQACRLVLKKFLAQTAQATSKRQVFILSLFCNL